MPDQQGHITVALADDHQLFKDGLRKLLETEPGFAVVAEASDGIEAIRVVQEQQPDILLLDIAMPRLGGMETLAALSKSPAKIIVLTAGIESSDLLHAMQLGARGVVLKESAARVLIDGIHRVMSGKFLVGAGIAENLAEAVTKASSLAPPTFGLTARELDVIAAVAAGESNRGIAERLKISLQTVKHHLTSIFDKTGTSSRLELALFSVRHGLADRD